LGLAARGGFLSQHMLSAQVQCVHAASISHCWQHALGPPGVRLKDPMRRSPLTKSTLYWKLVSPSQMSLLLKTSGKGVGYDGAWGGDKFIAAW
jgi:hypothetical protein